MTREQKIQSLTDNFFELQIRLCMRDGRSCEMWSREDVNVFLFEDGTHEVELEFL